MARLRRCCNTSFRYFLLGTFILYVLSSPGVYLCWKIYIQEQLEEMAATLKPEELIAFTVQEGCETQHEFEHQGKRYDVIFRSANPNKQTVTLYCIHDIIEEILIDDVSLDDEHAKLTKTRKHFGKKALGSLKFQLEACEQAPESAAIYRIPRDHCSAENQVLIEHRVPLPDRPPRA